MSFSSEKQLQELLVEALQTETFLDAISGREEIDDELSQDNNKQFIPGFQIDFQLRTLYCRKVKEVLSSFGIYNLITGEDIKNISIQKDTANKKERLYPDILISHPEEKRFSILELKKDVQTEREAVTELFAYAIELKNHLPNIADTDINLIIVATEFNTLLDHSISSIVLGTKFNILALKAGIEEGKLTLDLHIPDSWTDIWQNNLPEYAFSSFTLVPYQYGQKEDIPEDVFLFEIIEDLITFNGAKNNSHGFYIIWQNLSSFESRAKFCISLYQVNPFVFLQSAIDKNFTLNTSQPLSQYIIDNFGDNIYSQPESLMHIGAQVKLFLDRYFDTRYEDFSSWTDHMRPDSHFRSQALPVTFNSWGNIGDYIRHYFFHPSIKNGFFSAQQLRSPFFYKDPVFGIELINRISGKTLFEDGVYNFSSLFAFTKQLRELLSVSEWYSSNKKQNKRLERIKSRLFYATVEVLSSVREIGYRANYIDVKLSAPNPLKINPYGVDEDAVNNITEYCQWLAQEFLSNNPVHQHFFGSAINWVVLFMKDLPVAESLQKDLKKELVSYVKTQLSAILYTELIRKGSVYGDQLFSLLQPYFTSIDKVKKLQSETELMDTIESINDNIIVAHFENAFLPVLNLVYSEVFHPLKPFDDLTFITKDWKKLQLHLIKRFNEGHQYGAIILDNNGNVSIGIIPEQFQISGPINNPEEEVYILRNDSGIITTLRSTWEDVKSGKAFK